MVFIKRIEYVEHNAAEEMTAIILSAEHVPILIYLNFIITIINRYLINE